MTNLSVIEAIRSYIDRMIVDGDQNFKGFLMDKETVCHDE